MNDLRAPRAIKQYDYEHQKIVPIDVSCEESTSGILAKEREQNSADNIDYRQTTISLRSREKLVNKIQNAINNVLLCYLMLCDVAELRVQYPS